MKICSDFCIVLHTFMDMVKRQYLVAVVALGKCLCLGPVDMVADLQDANSLHQVANSVCKAEL